MKRNSSEKERTPLGAFSINYNYNNCQVEFPDRVLLAHRPIEQGEENLQPLARSPGVSGWICQAT
jgi:hypothetical protein